MVCVYYFRRISKKLVLGSAASFYEAGLSHFKNYSPNVENTLCHLEHQQKMLGNLAQLHKKKLRYQQQMLMFTLTFLCDHRFSEVVMISTRIFLKKEFHYGLMRLAQLWLNFRLAPLHPLRKPALRWVSHQNSSERETSKVGLWRHRE